jgi:PAS domain S-box-containing protein
MESYIFYVSIENITQQVELIGQKPGADAAIDFRYGECAGRHIQLLSTTKTVMRMTYFNDNAAAMFGYSRQEFQEVFAVRPYSRFFPGGCRIPYSKQIGQTIEEKKPLLRLRYRTLHKDGIYRWIQLNGHMVYSGDGVVNASAILMVIDEQVENELLNKRQAAQPRSAEAVSRHLVQQHTLRYHEGFQLHRKSVSSSVIMNCMESIRLRVRRGFYFIDQWLQRRTFQYQKLLS